MKIRNPFFDAAKYHHTPKGFRNPPGSPQGHNFSVELAREAAHFMGEMRHLVNDPYPFANDHVLSETEALNTYRQLEQPYKLTWLGHASFLITFNGRRVLTDPFLSEYASPLPLKTTRRIIPSAIAPQRLPPLDLIVISHNHYDHLDTTSLRALSTAHPRATVVVPLGLQPLITQCGFERIIELDWYEQTGLAGLCVQSLPAVHTSKRGLRDTNRSLWCGFKLTQGDKSVYFAGDTAYGEVFKAIGDKAGPFDLGLIPIGAYQPRKLMRPVHCTPEEAIQIGQDIGARHLVGMHWGTIRLTTEPMLEPMERFMGDASTLSRQVMRIGDTIAF
jgi:N-acyl-phosphatidylethanolamine-hydrolysing phospholipase D